MNESTRMGVIRAFGLNDTESNTAIYHLADLDDIQDLFSYQVPIKSYDQIHAVYIFKELSLSVLVRMQQHTKYTATYRF